MRSDEDAARAAASYLTDPQVLQDVIPRCRGQHAASVPLDLEVRLPVVFDGEEQDPNPAAAAFLARLGRYGARAVVDDDQVAPGEHLVVDVIAPLGGLARLLVDVEGPGYGTDLVADFLSALGIDGTALQLVRRLPRARR